MPTPFFLHTGWMFSPMHSSSYAYAGTPLGFDLPSAPERSRPIPWRQVARQFPLESTPQPAGHCPQELPPHMLCALLLKKPPFSINWDHLDFSTPAARPCGSLLKRSATATLHSAMLTGS